MNIIEKKKFPSMLLWWRRSFKWLELPRFLSVKWFSRIYIVNDQWKFEIFERRLRFFSLSSCLALSLSFLYVFSLFLMIRIWFFYRIDQSLSNIFSSFFFFFLFFPSFVFSFRVFPLFYVPINCTWTNYVFFFLLSKLGHSDYTLRCPWHIIDAYSDLLTFQLTSMKIWK